MTLVRWLCLVTVVFLSGVPAALGEAPSPLLRQLAEKASAAADKFWALSDQQKIISPEVARLNARIASFETSIAGKQLLLDDLRSGKTVDPVDPAAREARIHALAEEISRLWFERERTVKERGRIRHEELSVIPLEAARDGLDAAEEELGRAIVAESPRRTKSLRLTGSGAGRVLLEASWHSLPEWRALAEEDEKLRNALAEMRAKANILQRYNLARAQEFYDADQAWQYVLAKAIEQGVTRARIKIATQFIADSIDFGATALTLGGSVVAKGTYIALDAFLKGSSNYISARQRLAEVHDLANDRIGANVVEMVKQHLQERLDDTLATGNIDDVARGDGSSFGRIMQPLGTGGSSDWTTVPSVAKWLAFQYGERFVDRTGVDEFSGHFWRQRELGSKLLNRLSLGVDVLTTIIPFGVDKLDAANTDAVAERLVRLELKRFIAWQGYNIGRDELKRTAEGARPLLRKLAEMEQKLAATFELKLADGRTVDQRQVIEVFLGGAEEAEGIGALLVGLSEGQSQVQANVYWQRKDTRQLVGSGRSAANANEMSLVVFLPRPETMGEAWPMDLEIEIKGGDAASAFDAGASTAAFLALRPPDWKGYEKGKDIYKVRLSLADPLLGYWKRLGPFMIVNAQGETIDWPRGPVGFAIVDNPAADRKIAFLAGGGASNLAAFSALPGLKCKKLERAVICRLDAAVGCAGQWMEYRIALKDDGNGIFQVLDGQMSYDSHLPDQGCVKIPHPYLTGQKIDLQRELPMAEMEKRHPCPERFRCH